MRLPALFLMVTVTLRTLTVRPRSTLHHGWSSKLLKKQDFLWESGLGLESTANWGFRSPNTLLLEVGLPLAKSVLPKDRRGLILILHSGIICCIWKTQSMKSRALKIKCPQIITRMIRHDWDKRVNKILIGNYPNTISLDGNQFLSGIDGCHQKRFSDWLPCINFIVMW